MIDPRAASRITRSTSLGFARHAVGLASDRGDLGDRTHDLEMKIYAIQRRVTARLARAWPADVGCGVELRAGAV
jgi:hypothetical protein